MLTPQYQRVEPWDLSQMDGDEISIQTRYTASPTNAAIKSYDQNTVFLLLYLWRQFFEVGTVLTLVSTMGVAIV